MRTRLLWVAALLVLVSPAWGAGMPAFPALTGPVVDNAHILPPAVRAQLSSTLAAYAQAHGTQVVVVTLPTLDGYPIAEYGYQLGRHWGIGQKKKNNGALLLVDQAEHHMRIEVGYGLEGTLTDATSSAIIRNIMIPRFRAGQEARGIVEGTNAILQVLGGKIPAAAVAPAPAQQHRVVPGLFLLFALYLFLSALRARGAAPRVGFLPGLLLGLATGGFGGGSGGGGLGGGGGFGGGGGSFGGGGASGDW